MAESLPIVVLTGGIASGKTAVSECLAKLGAGVIDTDVIAKTLTQPGHEGWEAIIQHWGPEVLIASGPEAGSLDRRALRSRIFESPAERKALEEILHPLIMAKVADQVTQLSADGCVPYAVVVIPLYVETGARLKADAVVVVDTPQATQLQRLMARDDIDSSLAQKMIHAQATREARQKVATHIISNDQDIEALEQAVGQLHDQLIAQFSDADHRSGTPGQNHHG